MDPKHRNPKMSNYYRQQGQSLVEFALLLPILLVMIITTLELGRLFYSKIVITNAAREGAYYLSLFPSEVSQGIQTAVFEAQNSGIPEVTASATPVNCCSPGHYSVIVSVETTVENLLLLGFLDSAFSITQTHNGGFSLQSSVEMMVQ